MNDPLAKALRRRKRVGKRGENIAARFLSEKGYSIVDRNVRLNPGEIDIVARDGMQIVFIEVKTRSSTLYRPRTGWSPEQQKRLQLCANEYITRCELHDLVWRMELIEVVLGKWLFCKEIRHRQAIAQEYMNRYKPHAGERVRRYPR
jgi:putative endonuclease